MMLLVASCRTIRTSETVTHDTIATHHTDTVRQYVLKTLHDTIHHLTERVVTVNEGGDTIRLVSNTVIRERVVERDSTDSQHHSADSLAATHTAKETQKRQTLRPSTGGMVVLAIILGGCLWVIVRFGPPWRKE